MAVTPTPEMLAAMQMNPQVAPPPPINPVVAIPPGTPIPPAPPMPPPQPVVVPPGPAPVVIPPGAPGAVPPPNAIVPMATPAAPGSLPPQPAIAPVSTTPVPASGGEWSGAPTAPTAPTTPTVPTVPGAPPRPPVDWAKIAAKAQPYINQIQAAQATRAQQGKPTLQGQPVRNQTPGWQDQLKLVFNQIASEHGMDGLKAVLSKTFGQTPPASTREGGSDD